MRINLGCGSYPARGWTNVDVPALQDHAVPGHDYVYANAVDGLPFPSGSADRIYAGHVLEHIGRDDLPAVLDEVRRVLADDGMLLVVGPDIDRALQTGATQQVLDDIRGADSGRWRWPEEGHAWVPTEQETTAILCYNGFDCRPIRPASVPGDWPIVSRVDWQFALVCGKA